MTQLANLQSLFQGHVVNGDDAAASAFVGNATASANARLGVYYDAYRLRLLEILRDDFRGLSGLMSAGEFEALGLHYLDEHPSRHPNVRQFGRHLAGFLATHNDAPEQPYLAEMARLDWARGLAFDAAGAEAMTLEELGALPAERWPELKLLFHPTLQCARCEWNIVAIWRAINAEESRPQPVRLDQPEAWAVWRRGVTVYWRSLAETEAHAMDLFAEGYDFAGVCEALCATLDPETVPAAMANILNQWVAEGMVLESVAEG